MGRATIEAEDEEMEASRRAYRAKQEAAKQAKEEKEKEISGQLMVPGSEERESPAERLRRSSFQLLVPPDLPASSPTTFGFAERAADPPTAAATWLSMVTG